jgi:putative copper export protein/methionine-rich copper-binding protein CopC/ABC-type branched-subunit amino acid transport system substrate-binding protein
VRRRLAILAAALCAAAGWAAAPAAAHPLLVQAAPAPGVSQPQPPDAITLALNEAPIARGSSIRATGLQVGRVRVQGKALTAPLEATPAPGVYTVRWTALGRDGHATSGRFNFGVAGKNGAAPPGTERLAGAGGTGTGDQSAAAQDAISVIARWLLVLACSLLFGGGLLARRAGGVAGWRRAAPLALMLALVAAVEGVVAAATSGAGGSLDLRLVTATEPGIAALVRLGVLVLAVVVARWRRDAAWLAGGGLALASTAFDGHVASAPSPVLAGLGQVVHVVAAGLWLGGVLGLVVVSRWGGVPALAAARRFAPIAIAALAAAIVTGVIAAVREVDGWYFLRWSGYGRAVLVKSALVLIAAGIGGFVAWRGRSSRALRGEVVAVVGVAALASLLAALPQGRGQALPAARGNLLPGPALATVLGPAGAPAGVTLAPARAGANRIAVTGVTARSASVRLACACARDVNVPLKRTAGGFAADVDLPEDGTWYAYLSLDDKTPSSPAALPVGVPKAPGVDPVEVLAVADLSGPDAAACRDFLVGLQLGVGRLNALGGLDGHRKVALLARDDENSPAVARDAVGSSPVALAGACGPASGAAVRAAADRGIPAIVGDPSVPAGGATGAFRVAGDPAANAFAAARYVRDRVTASAAPSAHVVRLFASDERWIAGWRAGLGSDLRLEVEPPEALAGASRAEVRRLIDRRTAVAVGVDGPATALARAIARSGGPANVGYAPAPVIASGRTFSERFIAESGHAGRLGVVRGATEVTPDSADALAYAGAVRQLFPGSAPTLQGIRGYVTGLALGEAVKRGITPADLRARLRQPAQFTDALTAPYRSDAPDLGSQRFTLLGATFLSATLIPPSKGGESYSGTYFPDGAWSRLSSEADGPPLDRPPLRG